MPVVVRNTGVSADHFPAPRSLIDAIRECLPRLTSIEVQVRAGRAGYQPANLVLDIVEVLDGSGEGAVEVAAATPDTPDHIAERVIELATEHAEVHGPNHYRADGYETTGKGAKRETKLAFRKPFPITFDTDGALGAGLIENDQTELVQVLTLAVSSAKDHHKQHMLTLDKVVSLAACLEKIAEAAGTVFGKGMEFAAQGHVATAELEQARMEHEETMAQTAALGAIGEKLAAPLGEQLGALLFAKGMGVDAANAGKPKAEILQGCLDSLDDAGRLELAKLLGPDAHDLLKGAAAAESDQAFDEVVRSMVGKLQEEDDPTGKLNDLGELFDEAHKQQIVRLIMGAMGAM